MVAEIDRAINAGWPAEFTPESAAALLNAFEKAISARIKTCDTQAISIPAHAAFFELSKDTVEREAAASWWRENPKQAGKRKYVYDRHPGLERLHRLKAALAQGETDLSSFIKKAVVQDEGPPAPAPTNEREAMRQVVFAQPSMHGDFPSNLVRWVQQNRHDRNLVFLAFPPKCGGTFLRDALGQLVGASLRRPVHAYGGRDAVPYLPTLTSLFLGKDGPENIIMHAHMPGHYANLQTLNLFGVKPVVMTRNIPDMLRSYSDMFETEGREPDGAYNVSLLCGAHADETVLSLDLDQRRDFLVYHLAPWYIQFYASWVRAERENLCPVHWVDYHTLREQPAKIIQSVGAYYGRTFSDESIANALAETNKRRETLRFNKGVAGRGQDFFEPHHHDHFRKLAAGYPGIDFEALGLLNLRQV